MVDRADITAGIITETDSNSYINVGFIELLFDSDPVWVWTGLGQRTETMPGESSQIWEGIGDLGGIDGILESADRSINGVRLTMSGIDNDLLVNALVQDYQGRSVKIWGVFLDDDLQIIPDPLLVFGGQMDQIFLIDGDKTGAVTVQCESRDALLQRTSESLLTDEEQQRLFPGDRGLEFVMELQSKEIVWGTSGLSGVGGGGRNRRGNASTRLR